ncbi:MAG: hypothetical protein JHC30_06285 [Caldisericum sp.]|jgi:hypothetical protein|nr:hypothetical protein [Caldisericum sp.]
MFEEEITKEDKKYFRNLEKKFWKKYNQLSDWMKENFDAWVLENAVNWLEVSGHANMDEKDKNNFVDFVEMFSLVEIKPDDDLGDPGFINFIIKQAEKYVKYKKEEGGK